MLRKLISKKEEGFTLIELMIVIAIIGVLAAIAIPNFISYRNKSYCTQVEGDAKTVMASLASYFSNPAHQTVPTIGGFGKDEPKISVGTKTWTTTAADGINGVITIAVTKADANNCPRGTTFTTYMGSSAQGAWN